LSAREEVGTAFQEIREPKRKSAHVAEQILNQVRDRTYKVGELLPSERALAERMSVSRNAVREALSALQIAGVVETRVGVGTCVRTTPSGGDNLSSALDFARDSEDLIQIWDARKQIEIALLELAMNRAEQEALERIASHLEEMRLAVSEKDVGLYLAANDRFHLAIADGAENLPLRKALEDLQRFTNAGLLEEINRGYAFESLEKSLVLHAAILGALAARDVRAGIRAIEAHFSELKTYLQCRRETQTG
jgi:GntR family transcriptional repressor for pyruvate dehydrogenase complex